MTDTLAQAHQKLSDACKEIVALSGAAVSARLVTVQAGDTLSGVAARELGNGLRWPEIYLMNLDAINKGQAAHSSTKSAFSDDFSATEFGNGGGTAPHATTIYAGQQLLVLAI